MITTVFCFDFDETLMNTDRLRADLTEKIRQIGGEKMADTYTRAYEEVRAKHATMRMPLVLKAVEEQAGGGREKQQKLAEIFHGFPYEDYVYPGATEAVKRLKAEGQVIIFSDGDAFYQSQKVYATPIAELMDGVIILPKKVEYFADLTGYWPADRYVFIDDKPSVLEAAKAYFGERATTVFVRQGRYAGDGQDSTADMSVGSIAEVAGKIPLARE